MRRNNITKIAMACTAMLLSLAMLGLASFAWMTLSTNPEIRGLQFTINADRALLVSLDGVDYKQEVDMSPKFKAFANVLRPVSTYDGEHWYVCDYDERTGDVKQDTIRYLANGEGCNVEIEKKENETDAEYAERIKNSFYVYTDIYLKTEDESCKVYLSSPNGNETAEEKQKGHYGTYVMSYVNQEKSAIKLITGGAETCARVGMMFNPTPTDDDSGILTQPIVSNVTANGVANKLFYIYEPNADKRSELDKTDTEYKTDQYIIGSFRSKDEAVYEHSDGLYYQTYPVKYVAENGDKTWEIARFPLNRLIVQETSKWKTKDQIPLEDITSLTKEGLNSNLIGKIGQFATNTGQLYPSDPTKTLAYEKVNMSGTTVDKESVSPYPLCTLTKDKPVKVRLFFWIEGQDIDCWNDVAGTSFMVNLEFSGVTN